MIPKTLQSWSIASLQRVASWSLWSCKGHHIYKQNNSYRFAVSLNRAVTLGCTDCLTLFLAAGLLCPKQSTEKVISFDCFLRGVWLLGCGWFLADWISMLTHAFQHLANILTNKIPRYNIPSCFEDTTVAWFCKEVVLEYSSECILE